VPKQRHPFDGTLIAHDCDGFGADDVADEGDDLRRSAQGDAQRRQTQHGITGADAIENLRGKRRHARETLALVVAQCAIASQR
jgi:hypothetical protein